MVGTWCHVIKFPSFGKHLEVMACKMGSIVADNFVWNAIPWEVVFQLFDYSLTWGAAQAINFNEVAIVVHSCHVVLAIEKEQINANFLPRPVGYFCWKKWFWLLLYSLMSPFIPGQKSASRARRRHPSIPRWEVCILIFMDVRKLAGMTTRSPRNIRPSWTVSSSLKW